MPRQDELRESLNFHTPGIRKGHLPGMWPRVIRFLGYYPFPKPQTLSDRLIAFRRLRGLSIKELARQLGIDEGTLAKWENGERGPAGNRMGDCGSVPQVIWLIGLWNFGKLALSPFAIDCDRSAGSGREAQRPASHGRHFRRSAGPNYYASF